MLDVISLNRRMKKKKRKERLILLVIKTNKTGQEFVLSEEQWVKPRSFAKI